MPSAIQNEERRLDTLANLISSNLRTNGWSNIHCVGHFPDTFHAKLRQLPFTFTVTVPEEDDQPMDNVISYYSNIIVVHATDFEEFETAFRKAMSSPYWHPHSHVIIYYHVKGQQDIPKMHMIFWFYRACNAIVVQFDDDKKHLLASYYNPYTGDNYQLSKQFGCWKATKIGRVVGQFNTSFVCVEGCHNITLHSKLRIMFLGTCIGFETHVIQYGDIDTLRTENLFVDKSLDLHGFVLRAHGMEVQPFLKIIENDDGTYELKARDGLIWTLASERMNFRMDLSASRDVMKRSFNFDDNIQQIFKFAKRQADLLTFPVYLFDIIIVEIDQSIAYKDSGVCIMSHRADFETVLFDVKLLEDNIELFVKFVVCFLCIWLLFFICNIVEKGTPNWDQLGQDLVNAIRNILSISLHKPPKRSSFRIYMGISIWCFFVINFATQAAIISFFTAFKRGKDVDTFEDVVKKGYIIEGIASPDMMLPDTEEKFVKINSKLVSVSNLYDCVEHMTNNSRIFCLIDCAVGRFMQINRLNEKGEQYLHIATKDRIHSHYLTMLFQKHSPLTNTFNKWIRRAMEAGLILKWEQYRFGDIKAEALIKALSLDDLIEYSEPNCNGAEFG
ncbi:uncharacterized protein LOC126372012 [Pectinophora gossypiella]|uniref:uncharacterized protein LOC126372012 n=1 Tax=Pectinophora gossypiella TaxID=13191 RepID=UPI00214ED3CE|nr:uncharacterized protein LOC126372012 [Pectinophora gossypiella]